MCVYVHAHLYKWKYEIVKECGKCGDIIFMVYIQEKSEISQYINNYYYMMNNLFSFSTNNTQTKHKGEQKVILACVLK